MLSYDFRLGVDTLSVTMDSLKEMSRLVRMHSRSHADTPLGPWNTGAVLRNVGTIYLFDPTRTKATSGVWFQRELGAGEDGFTGRIQKGWRVYSQCIGGKPLVQKRSNGRSRSQWNVKQVGH